VAETLDYDRSTVSRYLNELVDIGLLEKSQLNRESGGVVNVYHSIDIERMRRETLVGFFVWAGEAASLIEEANLTKEAYLNEDASGSLQDVFWEDFRG
jgi:predicted transcriptional regulator